MGKTLLKAALIRAARTAAQSAISFIGTTAVTLHDVHWDIVVSGAALAAVLSILMSIATGLPEVDK